MCFTGISLKTDIQITISVCIKTFGVVFFSNDPSDFKTIIEVQSAKFFQAFHDSKPMETAISPLLSGILKTPD